MDYRDDIRTIEDSIMDLNDSIRRLHEAQDRLEQDPDNEELQSEVETLNAEVERDYRESRRLSMDAIKRYHPDMNDNVTDESREAVVQLNELNDRIRRIDREIHSSANSDEVEEQNENSDVDIDSSSNNIDNNNYDHSIADIFLRDRNITPPTADESNEFIPGTNFRKPRNRRNDETSDEYEEFLNNYYTNLFQNALVNSDTNQRENNGFFQPTSLVPVNEKDMDNVSTSLSTTNAPTGNINTPSGSTNAPTSNTNTPSGSTNAPTSNTNTPSGSTNAPTSNTNTPRTFHRIIEELGRDLSITKKDKKCLAANIKVDKMFKEELRTGNWLYNVVHAVPAVIKSAATVVNKYWSKFTTTKEQRDQIEELSKRIDNLSEEDTKIIWNEYRGGKVIQENFPSVLNVLLQQKMKNYALSEIEKLNNENTNLYKNVFNTYQQVNALNDKINDSSISDKERQLYINQKKNLLSNTVNEISDIRKNYIDANNWISGGYHGFEEDVKAAATKLNIVGRRFAKTHDYDNELQEKLADLSDAEQAAIINGDAEAALNAFVGVEQLESENTKIENSVFGKRSVGEKYYSPLVELLNYSDDPFVRDLFTTIAVGSAAVSAFNAFKTHVHDANQVVSDQQAQAAQVNATNNATMNQVRQTGQDIADKRVEFTEGIKAQAKLDVNNYGMTGERYVLDKTGGGFGWDTSSLVYGQEDATQHFATRNFSDYVNSECSNIANQVTSGAMNKATALGEVAKVAEYTQQQFQNLVSNYMGTLTQYAQNNPQFDLVGVQDAFQYILSNPNAIINMNQAAIDVTNLGESLTGLTAAQVTALSSLPSDMLSTLISSASAVTLASYVSSTMGNNVKTGKYGNEVTELVSDSLNKNVSSGKTI